MGISGTRMVRCDGCGGSLPVVGAARSVVCARCRHVQSIATELVRELEEYRQAREAHDASAHAAMAGAQRIAKQMVDEAPLSGISALIAFAFGLVPAAIVGVAAEAATRYGFLAAYDERGVDNAVKAVETALVGVGLLIAFLRARRTWRPKIAAIEGGAAVISCVACGGLNGVAPGQAGVTCRYCASSLVVPQSVLARGLDAAAEHARRARLERYRAERRKAVASDEFFARSVEGFLWPLFPLFAILLGWAVPSVLAEKEALVPYAHLVEIVGYWLGLVTASALTAYFLMRLVKRHRWRSAIDALASQLGAVRHRTPASVARWLDTFWAGPFPPDEMLVGPFGGAISGAIDGFPVLMIVEPVQGHENISPKLVILLAAESARAIPASPLRASIEEQRFAITVSEAGYEARASLVFETFAIPQSTLSLGGVAGALARLAAAAGARPAPRLERDDGQLRRDA